MSNIRQIFQEGRSNGIKIYSPAVKAATRYTYLTENFVVQDVKTKNNKYNIKTSILADISFFDIFDRETEGGYVENDDIIGARNADIVNYRPQQGC